MNILQTKACNFTVNTIGYEDCPYPIVFRNLCEYHRQEDIASRTGAPFHQILFVVEGEGEVIYNLKSYPLRRGCAFFTEAYHPVSYLDKGGLVSAFLTVTGQAAGSLAETLSDNGFAYADDVDLERYLVMLRRIKHECETTMDQGRLSSLVYEFFVDFLSMSKRGSVGYIDAALKYIEQRFSSGITLDDIARHSCVSVSKLSHGFKEKMGVSVFEYIVDLRLRYARNLILSPGRMMTKDAAAACGFSDVGYFCRAYKKRFGVTPTKDRSFLDDN
jgi:AraC-like DNA-binding protein